MFFLGGGLHPQGREQQRFVLGVNSLRGGLAAFGHQFPHALGMHRAVGQDEQLVAGDEAAEVFLLKLPHPAFGPSGHTGGVVHLAAGGHEAGALRVPREPEGFARNGETGFHLRAHRHEVQVFPQRTREIAVVLMASVEAHRLAEKAGADSDPDSAFHGRTPAWTMWALPSLA
jgi:hypothetical protein